jgi:hypothetical protein
MNVLCKYGFFTSKIKGKQCTFFPEHKGHFMLCLLLENMTNCYFFLEGTS